MPICKKCGKEFPNRTRLGGKIRSLSRRRFCLDCSPFGNHNTRNLLEMGDLLAVEKTCKKCGLTKPISEFYARPEKKVLTFHNICRDCFNQSAQDGVKRNRQLCLNYKGGRCVICGYNRCAHSLAFHHLDPSKKDAPLFNILTHRTFGDKVKSELDKCILVCANCHGEIHAGLVDLAALFPQDLSHLNQERRDSAPTKTGDSCQL